jgi:hypothetical protein
LPLSPKKSRHYHIEQRHRNKLGDELAASSENDKAKEELNAGLGSVFLCLLLNERKKHAISDFFSQRQLTTASGAAKGLTSH